MSEDKEKVTASEDSPSSVGESSALATADPQVEAKLEEIIDAIPEPKREGVRHSLQEFFGYIERSSPKIDPEVAKIIAASNDKDNEYRFKYLTQKQQDKADTDKRGHDFRVECHRDRKKLLWPIIIVVLLIVLGCIGFGIYFAATGHDILGASLLTGIFGAVFGYMAGIGTANFFKDK